MPRSSEAVARALLCAGALVFGACGAPESDAPAHGEHASESAPTIEDPGSRPALPAGGGL
jgi:hypothetical protein